MSYVYQDKKNLRLLGRINEFKFINDNFIEPEENRNVIEIGHWVKEILE
jgi:hypothetical protein